ncbi:MAG TPA: hypothetical protein PLP33_24810 [Leptospiraceae bacterium]|nr:hypothetical protein [Leptospiraceae bacterium]
MKIGNFNLPSWVVVLFGVFGLSVALVLCIVLWIFSALNSDTVLRNQLIQRNETAQTDYSAGYNILTNQYSLKKEEDAVLKDIYLGVVEGRYKNDKNVLFKMVTEQNPSIDREMAKRFFNSLEVYFNQRASNFKDLAELKRRHDTMLDTMPSSVIYRLFGREKIKIVYVKDSGTAESFKTGIDDRQIVK